MQATLSSTRIGLRNQQDFRRRLHEAGTAGRHFSPLKAGVVSWGLTVIAGATYGFFIFGFIGAAYGLFIAGAAAVPVAAVIFVALRIICPVGVSRNAAIISAAFCGCVTGFGSVASMVRSSDLPYAVIAGIVGAVVSAISAGLLNLGRYSHREPDVPPSVWQDLEPQLAKAHLETDWNRITLDQDSGR